MYDLGSNWVPVVIRKNLTTQEEIIILSRIIINDKIDWKTSDKSLIGI